MAITNGYTTLALFKTRFAVTETTYEASIEAAVEAASRRIDRYCGRRFWQDASVVTRVYTATDPQWLWTDDISTSTGLIVTTDDNWDGTYENTWTLDSYTSTYGFALEPPNAADNSQPWNVLAPLNSAFPTVRYGVKVVAKFGWAAVPTEIAEACMILARRVYLRKDSAFGVLQSPEFGEPIFLRKNDPDVAALLDPFCRTAGI
jgi:hypothetical protein